MTDVDVKRAKRRNTAIAVVVTVIMAGAVMTVAVLLADRITDASSNARQSARLLSAQTDARVRSECVTAYRGEWQNAIGDIVLVASRGNDPTPREVRALAQAQRHSLRLNDLCDPTQEGGVTLPPNPGGP